MSRSLLPVFACLLLAGAAHAAEEAPPPPPPDWGGAPPADAPPAPPVDAPPAPPTDAPPADAPPADPVPGDEPPAAPSGPVGVMPFDEGRPSPHTRDFEWNDLRNWRLASSVAGGVGLAHVLAAEPGLPGTLRFALHGEFFDASGFPVLETQNQRVGGTLALGFTPIRWVDVYGAYTLSSNRNSGGSPPLLQSQGDTWLGVKGGWAPADPFWIGGDLRILFFPSIGDQRAGAWGLAPSLLGTVDFRRIERDVPIRLHVNLGAKVDGTQELAADTLTAAEAFALNVNEFARFTAGIGLESPLPYVTPFVEYGVEVPLGAPTELEQPDGTLVAASQASPMKLTAGVRVTALEDVSFLLASDIGLQRFVVAGVPATPPYNLIFGVAYTVDPLRSPTTTVVEKVVEKPGEIVVAAPNTGKVLGTALDKTTRLPIGDVVVAIKSVARPGLPPVATDLVAGRFLTYDLPPGPVELTGTKVGYTSATVTANVEVGKEAQAELLLEKEAKPTALRLAIRGPAGPIDASVVIEGPTNTTLAVKGDAEQVLAAGRYKLRITSEGFLSREAAIDIADGGTPSLQIELSPKPKKTVLIIRKDKILTKRTIQFRSGSAEILPESFPILDEVAAAIIDNNYKKLRVDGHTDNQGVKGKNQGLSEERAASVRDYLVKAGLESGRIESAGFGDTRPIAPNLTARGRAMNRRVEFTILEP